MSASIVRICYLLNFPTICYAQVFKVSTACFAVSTKKAGKFVIVSACHRILLIIVHAAWLRRAYKRSSITSCKCGKVVEARR